MTELPVDIVAAPVSSETPGPVTGSQERNCALCDVTVIVAPASQEQIDQHGAVLLCTYCVEDVSRHAEIKKRWLE